MITGINGSRKTSAGRNDPALQLFPDMPCYTFNEATGVFVFLGRNAKLKLLSSAQMVLGNCQWQHKQRITK
jgi:hypothetical protein